MSINTERYIFDLEKKHQLDDATAQLLAGRLAAHNEVIVTILDQDGIPDELGPQGKLCQIIDRAKLSLLDAREITRADIPDANFQGTVIDFWESAPGLSDWPRTPMTHSRSTTVSIAFWSLVEERLMNLR
jgi:hypothetical protein